MPDFETKRAPEPSRTPQMPSGTEAMLSVAGGLLALAGAVALQWMLLPYVRQGTEGTLATLWGLFWMAFIPAFVGTTVVVVLAPAGRWGLGLGFTVLTGLIAFGGGRALAGMDAPLNAVLAQPFALLAAAVAGGVLALLVVPRSRRFYVRLLPLSVTAALVALVAGIGVARSSREGLRFEQGIRATVPAYVEREVAPKVVAGTVEIDWREPTEPRAVWTEFHGTVRGTDIRVAAYVSHDAPLEPGRTSGSWWYLDRVTFTIPQPRQWTASDRRTLKLHPDLIARLQPAAGSLLQVARSEELDYAIRANVPVKGSNAPATVVTVTAGARPDWPGSH